MAIEKAMNIINSHHLNVQSDHYKNMHSSQNLQQNMQNIQSPNNLQSSQNKNKNIKDYIYKPSNPSGINSPYSNNMEVGRDDDKESQSTKYSSNLILRDRVGTKSSTPTPGTNNTFSGGYTPNDKGSSTPGMKSKDPNAVDKQNINIVLINNHINRYVINQEALNAKNNQNNQNNNQSSHLANNHSTHHSTSLNNNLTSLNPSNDNMKKHKSINTFRSSNNPSTNIYTTNQTDLLARSNNHNNPLNRSNNNMDGQSSVNYTGLNVNMANNKYNMKNLNVNSSQAGVDIKSPILKNNSSNSKVMPSSHMGSNVSKYSSLIDNNQNHNSHGHSNQHSHGHGHNSHATHTSHHANHSNHHGHTLQQNSSRPSSAIILKGRHSRDMSNNSVKNEAINMNVNSLNSYMPINRSPSSQNMPQTSHGMNRNYSRGSLNTKRETPRNNYLLNLDKSLTPSGNKTVRPSSTHDRLRINYSSNLNPLSSMNNMNNLKVANRYDVDDLINRRGYSLSSRANDLKTNTYRYEESKVRYQTPSKNYLLIY